ncbi:hypothetical protein Droror1_Dr00011173 [Drosera rotundifolia]
MRLWDDPSSHNTRRRNDPLHHLAHVLWDIGSDGSATLVSNTKLLDMYSIGKGDISDRDFITVLSSCNGLILFSASIDASMNASDKLKGDLRLFVCNPVTRSLTVFPRLAQTKHMYYGWMLGFSRCAKKYKVVGVAYHFGSKTQRGKYDVTVFTLGDSDNSSHWRTPKYETEIRKLFITAIGERSIWFLSNRIVTDGEPKVCYYLYSMDLNSEVVRDVASLKLILVSLPKMLYEADGCLYCGVAMQTLGIEIWSLGGSDSWAKKYSFCIPSDLCHLKVDAVHIRVAGVVGQGKRLILRTYNGASKGRFLLVGLEAWTSRNPSRVGR